MGLRPVVLCLLASLVLFAAAFKDCDDSGNTYKHGDIMNMRCEICECHDGSRRFCERKQACDSMNRRALSEDAQKLNYLDEPGVIESSFDRKKRSLSPVLDDEFIDNINAGENTSEDEDGCLFDHTSMAHGESTMLRCLECTCNHGAVSCVRDFQCPGICSVSSFQMIRTFDGSLYDSPGTCSYMLVKTSDFTIYLHNMQCEENEEAVCIQAVEVHITPALKVKLMFDGSIVSDNGVIDLPLHMNDLITIRRSSSVFWEVVSTLGFALHYDFKGHRVYVIMDTAKKNSTKGLCGTFNDNRNDDFMSSNGMLERVAELSSITWKMDQSCSEVARSEVNIHRMVAAKDKCDSYLDESIFADCRTIIDITSYKASCTSSIYFGEDLGGMCSALADYTYHCGFAGITVPFRSSFSDCELNCQDPLIPATLSEFSNRDCREYVDQLPEFPAASMLNEVCVCPSDQYYDSTLDTCVDGEQCPCYANNLVYRLGEMVKFSNGKECGCQRIMECSDENIPTPVDPIHCPEGEVYSDCSNGVGKSCEKSCLNLEMIDQSCPTDCLPGCICQYGSYRDDEDECVPLSDCKCIHGGDKYNPGETMVKDCNTCTCNDGRFECAQNTCTSVCNAYGESQFILFDQVWKKFPTADCTMILVMSENPPFAVTAASVASRQLAGSFSTKNITIVFGETYVLLTEFGPQVMYNPTASRRNEVNFYRAGFYTVADFPEGLTVYYDLHLDVVIQLQPQLQGKVEGICGDADGTTTYEFSRGNMLQYGSQFLAAGCPHDRPTIPPPSGNHTIYIEERCSLLKSDVFFPCHSVVSVDSYYSACVEETASCREGESCLCFCTAVAAYARACCRSGISVDWRTADTCPAPCEYYNGEAGEGPYHLTNMNQLRLVAESESGHVILSPDDDKEDLQASFMITPGLYKDVHSIRPPISLESALYPNYFIVQDEDGSVHLEKWQSSVNFRKRATFIWRKNRWMRGYDALESFTQRGYYLTAGSDNSLSVTKYIKSSTQAASFKLTMESFGLPFFSLCLWRYKTCEPPCIKTCQDPYGTKCSLSLNVEGCFPHCAEGLVFDEETHRCVHYEHCINEPTPEPTPLPSPTPVIATTPPDECKHVTCSLPHCKVGAIPHKVQHQTDSCCEEYICECYECPGPPPCGLGLVAVPQFEPEKECCPSYTCECGVCPEPPECHEGFILISHIDENNRCCPDYECVPKPTTPGTTTPKTTTRDECEGVTCHVPQCTRTGETLVPAPSDAPCCPAYTCGCLPCPSPPTCNLGYILKTRKDEKIDCCPSHTCVCPECSDPPQCRDGSVLRKITNLEKPCCPEYECEPITTPETINTPTPCSEPCARPMCTKEGAFLEKREGSGANPCCPEYECVCSTCPPPVDCGPGFEKETHFNEEKACCPTFSCHLIQATTPAIVTTTRPAGCEGVTCSTLICERDGEVPVPDPSDHSCCPRSSCECLLPCPPDINCGPGVQPVKKIDIETQCCPIQTCPHDTKPRTTPAATTLMDQCAHVTCPMTICGKTGAVPVFRADPCCKVCECHECPPAHECGFGLIAVPHFDSTKECCPTYTCECPPTCPPAIACEPGYTLTSHYIAGDACCPNYICVLSTTTPRSIAPTTPQDICQGVTCAVPACTRAGELPVTGGSAIDCCPNITCVCHTCEPALECGLGLIPVEAFNSDIECCPRYTCECPPTCTPPEECKEGTVLSRVQTKNVCCPEFECVPLPTVPPSPPTPDICHLVTCAVPGCKKTGQLPHQIDEGSGKGSGEDPCCPEYECNCQPCPPPQVCGAGFDTEETFDANHDCCPGYRCVPQPPTTTTPRITTTPYHNPCEGVTCANAPQCTKIGSVRVQLEGSGEETCCPESACVCEPCSSAPTCHTRHELKTFFEPNVECCPRYECEPPCVGITCAPPPSCPKTGETAVQQEESGKKNCCAEYVCVCQECPPAPVCQSGWKSKTVVHPLKCCPVYTCEPPCFGVTCAEPPQCPKEGQIPVHHEGSGEDECCPEYDCECTNCHSVPDCPERHRRIKMFSPAEECCPRYICEPPSPCEGVTCSSPPQCTKKGETVVQQGRTKDGCCPVYKCECETCHSAPDCLEGYHRIETFNPDAECCPRYICQPPCFGVTCLPPPQCPKRGQTAVRQEGSGEDHCCAEYECECEFCPLPPKCSDGFRREREFDENTVCCPTYICVPPCDGVTCAPPPQCIKTGESVVRQEGSGHDNCCPDEECRCETCSPAPGCPPGHHRETFFNPEMECCERYTCGPKLLVHSLHAPTPTPETVTTPPTTTLGVCNTVTCSDPPQCQKSGARVTTHFGADPCCPTYGCECPECGPLPHCPAESQRNELFDPDTNCCPIFICVPPCDGVTCAPPPQCTKTGESVVRQEGSGHDNCCSDEECHCEPCSPEPVCAPGLKLITIFNEETECCPRYTCEPREFARLFLQACTGIICAPPPTCPRTGEVPVEIPVEGSGSGDDECCADYICECQNCSPAPECPAGFRRLIWIDPEVECCPHYTCVCDLCAPPPTCEDEYRREVVPDPESVCCSRYICVPMPTTTPEPPRTPPTTTLGPCQAVICSSPPQCKKVGEAAVKHWSEGSGLDECCPHYTCECQKDCSPPQCDYGFTLKRFTDEEHFCCPQYTCEPPCVGVTCADPPVCHRIGETAVEVEGSGHDDQCCDEYKCECHECAPKPNCPAGFNMETSFNHETECCPHYTCEPPCLGVTCPGPPTCEKIGETPVVQEGSRDDPCCSQYKCVCSPCPPAPDCGPGYVVEPTGDSQERCCPQYNCKPIPTTPATIPPTTTPLCAHVTCRDITCKPNERLVERTRPPQACCSVFECEPIPTIPGSLVPPPTTPELCNHVTCTVKACKPHEKLVQRPTPPQACCPLYDCECQCDSVPTCGRDERLVPVHQVNQCCPRLKCERKKDECHTVPKAVHLVDGECEATVQLHACSGYCHSSTEYSHRWEPVPHCQCCSVKRTHTKKFEIPCPNGKKTTLVVKEAAACSCQSCSGEDNSSGEQSGNSSEEQQQP